jgi:hypothetical protein
MRDPWQIKIEIDYDLYSQWRRHLSSNGIKNGGPGSIMRETNSRVFSEAIKAKMEENK